MGMRQTAESHARVRVADVAIVVWPARVPAQARWRHRAAKQCRAHTRHLLRGLQYATSVVGPKAKAATRRRAMAPIADGFISITRSHCIINYLRRYVISDGFLVRVTNALLVTDLVMTHH